MTDSVTNILVVDDEPKNLRILEECLSDASYNTLAAADGVEAWSALQDPANSFSVILLDRMMPNMDGMEVLKRIKDHPELKAIPVIMQTAVAEKHEVLEGLQAGCYYYLAKPFDEEMLVAIVGAAIADYHSYQSLRQEMKHFEPGMALLEYGRFRFRTLAEGRNLAKLLAALCPDSGEVAVGLSELIINAVEHGNLGISYDAKTKLLRDQDWAPEVVRRQCLREYSERYAMIEFERGEKEIVFTIRDQGDGFEWRQYIEFSADRAGDSHGRGIAMAKMLSFDTLEYRGNGSEVRAGICT